MDLKNCYGDARRAAAYAELEFPGTYFLAYRDLPALIAEHVRGGRAIDFGCGTGRSTRFLEQLGFKVVGVDIAEDMIARARALDPRGDYRLLDEVGLGRLPQGEWDLALSAFTFDNVPTLAARAALVRAIARLLGPRGRFVNLVSSPEIYINEWASFSTKDFPENRQARSGDRVRIVITEIADSRPVEDVVCGDEDYRRIYAAAGLEPIEVLRPLGKPEEPQPWVNETRIAPWVIYVLGKAPPPGPATRND